jgi:hypothetical protein
MSNYFVDTLCEKAGNNFPKVKLVAHSETTQMPPLLSAFLMIVLGCDLRIVQAIDLGMEWRLCWSPSQLKPDIIALAWYNGFLGSYKDFDDDIGTFLWPRDDRRISPRYK